MAAPTSWWVLGQSKEARKTTRRSVAMGRRCLGEEAAILIQINGAELGGVICVGVHTAIEAADQHATQQLVLPAGSSQKHTHADPLVRELAKKITYRETRERERECVSLSLSLSLIMCCVHYDNPPRSWPPI